MNLFAETSWIFVLITRIRKPWISTLMNRSAIKRGFVCRDLVFHVFCFFVQSPPRRAGPSPNPARRQGRYRYTSSHPPLTARVVDPDPQGSRGGTNWKITTEKCKENGNNCNFSAILKVNLDLLHGFLLFSSIFLGFSTVQKTPKGKFLQI